MVNIILSSFCWVKLSAFFYVLNTRNYSVEPCIRCIAAWDRKYADM